MLVSLPECLFRTIVGEWLEMKSITRLDSAHCARRYRSELLSAYQDVSNINIKSKAAMSWMIARRMSAIKVVISAILEEQMLLDFFAICKTTIRSLDTTNSASFYKHTNLTMATLKHLTEYYCGIIQGWQVPSVLECTHLQKLSVQFDNPGWGNFEDMRAENLTELSIKVLKGSDANMTAHLIACAPNLQKLSIVHEYSRSAGLDALFTTRCVHLKCLKLQKVMPTDDEFPSMVAMCPNVVHLDLQNCCEYLTDNKVLFVAQNLHLLRTINLFNCSCITNRSLQHLGDHCAATLNALQLGNNYHITRAGIDHVRQQCRNLRTFRCVENLLDNAGRKATILEARPYFGCDIVWHTFACDTVEYLNLSGSIELGRNVPTRRELKTLCTILPNLHTVVVLKHDFNRTVEAARELPQLTVNTDRSAIEYDLMSMPI